MIGIPTPLTNGNFEVQYQLVVENNKGVDLVDVSFVDDLKSKFGDGTFKSVGGLILATPPKDAASSIALNVSGWDGTTDTDLIDQSVQGNRLAAGDWFVVGFSVEVDASVVIDGAATSVAGAAVGRDGVPLIDVSGDQIEVIGRIKDTKDSSSAAATAVLIPRIGLVKAPTDVVSKGRNWEVQFSLVWGNAGTVALDRVEIFDDVAARLGGQFCEVTLDSVTAGENNRGSTPRLNARFELDTSKSLVVSTGPLEVGDWFEVAFTVTVNPLADGSTVSALDGPATSYGLAVDSNGTSILLADGAPAITYRVSKSGGDPFGDNEKDNLNGKVLGNLSSSVTANVSLSKSIVGKPLALPDGNLVMTYEVVTKNTGTVDLADLRLAENLESQSNSVFKKARNLMLASAPKDARSLITIDGSWNGIGSTSLIQQTASTRLAVGDSFNVRFSVELDGDALGLPRRLENEVALGSEAIQENTEASVVADSHPSFSSDVAAEPAIEEQSLVVRDNRESNAVRSPSYLANITVTKAVVAAPVLTDRGHYVVSYRLTVENRGTVDLAELSLQEDLATQFGPSFVKAGNLSFTGDPSDSRSNLSVNSAGWNGKISTELLDSAGRNVLVAGDSFTIEFDVEIKPQPEKPAALGETENEQSLNAVDRINGYVEAPGPIYSGTPVTQDSSVPVLGSGPINAGRYTVGQGSIFTGV